MNVMKQLLAILLSIVCLGLPVCKTTEKQTVDKLIEIEKYASLTIDGTSSIGVVYDYIKGEIVTYEFVIEDQTVIQDIMKGICNMELEDYPEGQDIDFYQRWVTVTQGDDEYFIHLGYTSDERGNRYLCQSQAVCEIIENYIEENVMQ